MCVGESDTHGSRLARPMRREHSVARAGVTVTSGRRQTLTRPDLTARAGPPPPPRHAAGKKKHLGHAHAARLGGRRSAASWVYSQVPFAPGVAHWIISRPALPSPRPPTRQRRRDRAGHEQRRGEAAREEGVVARTHKRGAKKRAFLRRSRSSNVPVRTNPSTRPDSAWLETAAEPPKAPD